MTSGPILVTGASGFVGQHLLPALRGAFPGARLVAGSRRPGPSTSDSCAVNLDDAKGMRETLRALSPSVCIHLAAQSSVQESFRQPAETLRANVLGTVELASALMDATPDCLLVFASSAEIYGATFHGGHALTEDAPLAPMSPYAVSKAAADLALGELAMRGLRSVRLRFFNHTGAGQQPAFSVPAFARQVARIEAGLQVPRIRVGSLDRWRDFLDVGDVCAAYAAVIEARDRVEPGAVFNIASGVPRRIGDVLNRFVEMAGVRVDIEEDPTLVRPSDIVRVLGNASLAERTLGWHHRIPFSSTLDTVLADWRARVRSEASSAAA